MEEAELDSKMNRTKQLYQQINAIRGGYRKHNKFLKNENDSLTTKHEEILENGAIFLTSAQLWKPNRNLWMDASAQWNPAIVNVYPQLAMK